MNSQVLSHFGLERRHREVGLLLYGYRASDGEYGEEG